MGLNAELQDELGTRLDGVADSKGILDRLLAKADNSDFPFLSCIDPYGDTTFNRLQMSRFLAEWAVVRQSATTEDEIILWGQVEALAKRCAGDVHLYLKFIKD